MVKPNWDTEELIENWTLLPQELELAKKKVGGNRIGFALLLKHFQLFAYFPEDKSSISPVVISYIASQVNLPESSYSDYYWLGRSAKAYRSEIRCLFNFKVASVQDSEEMVTWLIDEILPKEIWVVGANRYRNPELDLPTDFETKRQIYYQALTLPEDVETFISGLQQQMAEGLEKLDKGMPRNKGVTIGGKGNKGLIRLSPFDALPDPINLRQLKGEINRLWHKTSLLDILKETDLRVDFTRKFKSMGTREILDRETLQKRLLLCLFGMGTNTGLKRINTGIDGEITQDLIYVRRRYIHKDQLRSAIAEIVNATFEIRLPHIWGEGTTTCASDSKHFGAWEQNLITQYHLRYGGRGVMIYWHVEENSTCIYSQLKTCSSCSFNSIIKYPDNSVERIIN